MPHPFPDETQTAADACGCFLCIISSEDIRLNGDEPALRVRGKGNRNDIMPLPPQVGDALRAWLAIREPDANDPKGVLLYGLTKTGRPRERRSLNLSSINRIIGAYFPNHSPHGLRVRCLTDHYENGHDLNATREYARHASESTIRIYIRANMMRHAAQFAPEY